jgi:group I intron endonuclease
MMGIYSIKNKINGKIYIGQSRNIEHRKKQHRTELKCNVHRNTYLQHAYNKYGADNFEFELIEEVYDSSELNKRERWYIKNFSAKNPSYGYNLTDGGDATYSLNEDVKNRISLNKRGQNTNLTVDEVRRIKMALYCLMDRKEICDIFNVSPKVVTQIATGKNFVYVCEELNSSIHNMKQKLIDERNAYILQLFNEGKTIAEIVQTTKYTTSIVEKCVYKYTNTVEFKNKNYQEIYDKVFELHEKGVKNYHISKQLHISPSTVQRYLTGQNDPYKDLPFKKVTDDIKDNIIDMYFNQNKTSTEIGDIYNITYTTVMSFINNYKYANTEVI